MILLSLTALSLGGGGYWWSQRSNPETHTAEPASEKPIFIGKMVMDTVPLPPLDSPSTAPLPEPTTAIAQPIATAPAPSQQQWQASYQTLSAQYAQMEAKLTRLRATEQQWQQAAQNAQTEHTQVATGLQQANAELARLQQTLNAAQQTNRTLTTQITELQERADPLANAKLAQLQRQFQQLQQNLAKATVENKALQAQFTRTATQTTAHQTRQSELTQQLATAQARIQELETALKARSNPAPHTTTKNIAPPADQAVARVSSVNPKLGFVVLTRGSSHGVANQDRYRIFNRTGKFLGRLRIESAQPTVSIALFEGPGIEQVAPGDYIHH